DDSSHAELRASIDDNYIFDVEMNRPRSVRYSFLFSSIRGSPAFITAKGFSHHLRLGGTLCLQSLVQRGGASPMRRRSSLHRTSFCWPLRMHPLLPRLNSSDPSW